MIRLSHYFKAIYMLGLTQDKMGKCFGNYDKASVNEWIKGKKRTALDQFGIFSGTENCRKLIGLDKKEFIIRLIDNLDSSQITVGEKNELMEIYNKTGDYDRFLEYLINKAYQNSYEPAKHAAIVYDPRSVVRHAIGIGIEHIAAVRDDGRVFSTGANDYNQCNVHSWRNIVSITCGWRKTVALRSDGTCIEIGNNPSPNAELYQWRDIIAVEAGPFHTLGLCANGSVVSYGRDQYGQCHLDEWHGITAIAAGSNHSVGLRSDGTVVAKGSNQYGQCELSSWRNIVQIAAAGDHTVGLTRDGHVLTAGDTNEFLLSSPLEWNDIVSIATGSFHIIGLTRNQNVVSAGFHADNQCEVSDWQYVIAIFAGYNSSAAIRKDGRVLLTRSRYTRSSGFANTADWYLFNDKGSVIAGDIDSRNFQLRELLLEAKQLILKYIVSCQAIQLKMDLEEPFDDYEANDVLKKMVENIKALSEFQEHTDVSPFFSERITSCIDAFNKYYSSVECGIGKLAKSHGRYLTMAENDLMVDYFTLIRTTIQELNQRLGNASDTL